MAFYQEDDDDQLENSGGVATSGQSGLISGGPDGAVQANAQGQGDKSGNFVGIQKYLDANKSQANKLGDQTAGVINTSADQARQGVNALNQAASEQVKSIGNLDSSLADKLSNGAENLSQDERKTIKDTASASYQGPHAVTGLGDTYTNAQKATQTATRNIDNSGTEEGRMDLITQVNSKPRTQGMNVFDNALLQAGGGREKVASAATANKDVKSALDTATQGINQNIEQAKNQTQSAQQDAYSKIQNAMNAWKTNFTPKVAQAQNDLISQQGRIASDIADNPYELDQETMDLLGLREGQSLYNTDLNQYLQFASPSDINASNVATAEDYARYSALADLAGEKNLVLKPEDIGKAGTSARNKADISRLASDLGKDYQNAYNSQSLELTNPLNPRAPDINGLLNNTMRAYGDLGKATPEELENKWLPALAANYQNSPYYSTLVNTINSALNQFKNAQGANNIVKRKKV